MRICPQRLAELRRKSGLTGAAFGAAIGVSKAYISQLESGKKTTLDETKARALCQRYRCDLAWLVNSTGPPAARRDPAHGTRDVYGPEWIAGGEGAQRPGPKPAPAVERRPDGTLRYNFVGMWSNEQLREILPAAEAAEDWDLVASIASEMRRRRPSKG
jgi:transcriptional regulator with XRE-family HTH domain